MKKLTYFIILVAIFLFSSCPPGVKPENPEDVEKEKVDISFVSDWYKVRLNVDDKEISTNDLYKINKNESFTFSIPEDESFEVEKVEYKYTEDDDSLYKEIISVDRKYTIDNVDNNIKLKISVTLNKTTIKFTGSNRIEQVNIKYKTETNEEIQMSSTKSVVLGECYSFKFDNSYSDKDYYNVKITLKYNSKEEELLPSDNEVYTISGSITQECGEAEIIVEASYITKLTISVSNSEYKDILKIRRVVGEQSILMPSSYNEVKKAIEIGINRGEEFNFKIELADPTQYEITRVMYYKSSTKYPEPSPEGVYTISQEDCIGNVQLTITLKAFWYPLTVEGGAKVFYAEGTGEVEKLTPDKQTHVVITPEDQTKSVVNVKAEYKAGSGNNTWRETKDLAGLKNEKGVNVYTLPTNIVKDDVKLIVTLGGKNIKLSVQGDGVKWETTSSTTLPEEIERFSYFSFKVEPTESGKVIDKVEATYSDTTTAILPNQNGIYTLTPDMTEEDEITLNATVKTPENAKSITFKGNKNVVFKDSDDTVITEKSILENSEFKFKVEASDTSVYEIDRVYAVYNATQTDLKETNGVYTLSSYITSYDIVVVAEVKYRNVKVTLDSASDYTITGANDEAFIGSLPYKTEYKFKVSPKDTSKKITRISVQSEDGTVTYLYQDKNGVYTLQCDDVIDNITLVVNTVKVKGELLTVIEKDQTVNVEEVENKIPYVLITNFTPSENYASESLKNVPGSSWYKVRSNNIYTYSLSTTGNTAQSYSLFSPRSVSGVSAPEIKNGKVEWNDYKFSSGSNQYTVNYKELYTDTSNKIIYLISDKYSVEEGSRARKIIDCMYSTPDSKAKMQPDLLISLQKNVAEPSDTFPNKTYLFDKSETDRGYFFVMIDTFSERGYDNSILGYFTADIYTGSAKNTPYAVFYLNTLMAGFDSTTSDPSDGAVNFIDTFSHEYTHYLEKDYKYTKDYENALSINFLSEGYANYNAAKGQKDVSAVSSFYLEELLKGRKIYDPKDSDDISYGLGHLFFLYIEEKYGEDMPSKIMRDDKDVFKAVEDQTGKTFGDVYNDFILNLVLSGYTDTVSVNGTNYGDMGFAKYTSKYDGEMHAFEEVYSSVAREVKQYKEDETEDTYVTDYGTGEAIYNDVKMILDSDEGISSSLGEMSFRLVCYPSLAPSTLTLTSESPFIKAYLFYSDKAL